MRKSIAARFVLFIPALLVLSGGMVATLWAHKGHEHDTDTTQTVAAATTPTASQARDSLFAVINQEFSLMKPIFERSCYDCHSKFTHYPWYYKLPLIKSMIDSDIKKACKHLECSEGFPFGGHGHILETLADIKTEINEGDMPPWDYRLMHWGTAIDGARRDSVIQWLDSTISRITALYVREGLPLPQTKDESGDKD